MGWFVHEGFPASRDIRSPADLAALHLIISPPSAKLHAPVMKWFADAKVMPVRISTCNSLSITVQAVVKGLGLRWCRSGSFRTRSMRTA
jgi:hypothetical protein